MAVPRTSDNPYPPGTVAEASYEFQKAWRELRAAFKAEAKRIMEWIAIPRSR